MHRRPISHFNRRGFLAAGGALAATGAFATESAPLHKTIPSSGERIVAIGMGTWLTFDVGDDAAAVAQRTEVLRAFLNAGGSVVDSSPMYGSSQAVVGEGLRRLGAPVVFSADKVWTRGDGAAQIAQTKRRWGVDRFDLLQIHNLVDWRRHLPRLFEMRQRGEVRYVGITTYGGLRHGEAAEIIEREPVDFLQCTYNILDREAERRLLPLARERGVAVIANRPFREGALFNVFRGRSLPPIAAEIGAETWAQFMLKFIISHPALTVAIPATRRVDHMQENMAALSGPVPDEAMRRAMAQAAEDA